MRLQEGISYRGVFPSRNVIISCQSAKLGSISRKRQTPLSSTGRPDVRRWRQSSRSTAASIPVEFQPGYTISSRSSQAEQRKFRAASWDTAPQPMHRSCDVGTGLESRRLRSVVGVEVSGILSRAIYFPPRRYLSVLLIQSARGGLNTSRSTLSSNASAL